MNLYEKWQHDGTDFTDQGSYNAYWAAYFEREKSVYQKILAEKTTELKGTLSELATYYNMSALEMVGFLDGINTSLKEEVNLEEVVEETEIFAEIEYEKLLFNMYKAKAEWLYELEEWEDIFDEETRGRIKREYYKSASVRVEKTPGRNEPCPCGSGKKYKKCCLNK